MNAAHKAFDEILVKETNKANREGLNEGWHVAQRILAWWSCNHKLKNPHSRATLEKWSLDAMQELRDKENTYKVY